MNCCAAFSCAIGLSVFGMLAVPQSALADPTIYMTTPDGGGGGSAGKTVPGSNSYQPLMQFPQEMPIGVGYYNNQFYSSSLSSGLLWRCGPNGENITPVLSRGSGTYIRQIQFHEGMMYWNEEGNGRIYRALPDGSNIQQVYAGPTGYPAGIWDFTIANNRFYWTSWDSDTVRSVRLDGTDPQQFNAGYRVFSIESFQTGLVLSLNNSTGIIKSVNFDGTNPTILATLPSVSELTGLSVFGDRAYFSWSASGGHIASVPLAGGQIRPEFDGPRRPFQIMVVPAPASLFVLAGSMLAFRRRR